MKEYISLITLIMFSMVIYSIKMRTITNYRKLNAAKKSKRVKQREQRWRRSLERKLNMPKGFINNMVIYEYLKKRYDEMNP